MSTKQSNDDLREERARERGTFVTDRRAALNCCTFHKNGGLRADACDSAEAQAAESWRQVAEGTVDAVNKATSNRPEPAEPATSKDKVLFYLGRHLRDAEARASVDLERMAKEGKSMTERRAAVGRTEEAQHEAKALRVAFEFIRNNMAEK